MKAIVLEVSYSTWAAFRRAGTQNDWLKGFETVKFKYLLGLMLVPAVALAQDVIKLNMSDIFFQWRPMPKGSAMCGFALQGNHFSRENPRTEWDINIDEIVTGGSRIAGISAGSFVVTDKVRTPRAAITAMTFTTEDDAEPLSATIVGVPNKDNGVRALLDLTHATKLFNALSNDRRIFATLNYADGSIDHLQFSGLRDRRNVGGGRNNPFDQCLRGETPKGIDWDIRRYKN